MVTQKLLLSVGSTVRKPFRESYSYFLWPRAHLSLHHCLRKCSHFIRPLCMFSWASFIGKTCEQCSSREDILSQIQFVSSVGAIDARPVHLAVLCIQANLHVPLTPIPWRSCHQKRWSQICEEKGGYDLLITIHYRLDMVDIWRARYLNNVCRICYY